MKQLALTLTLLLSVAGYSQMADYNLQEITIELQDSITDCELTLIINDQYIPTKSYSISGRTIALQLADYQDYLLIVNKNTYINLTVNSRDIIDERDIDISADYDYTFNDGVLVMIND